MSHVMLLPHLADSFVRLEVQLLDLSDDLCGGRSGAGAGVGGRCLGFVLVSSGASLSLISSSFSSLAFASVMGDLFFLFLLLATLGGASVVGGGCLAVVCSGWCRGFDVMDWGHEGGVAWKMIFC